MKLIHTEYNPDGTVKAVEHLEVSDERGHEIMKDEVWREKMGFPWANVMVGPSSTHHKLCLDPKCWYDDFKETSEIIPPD